MARQIVKRDQDQNNEIPVDKAPMVGGTTGQPEDPNPPSAHIYGIDDVAPARMQEEKTPEVLPRSFRVVGGPDSVVYDGQRVRVQLGNVYRDTSTDIDLLKRQGVKFEEITAE